MREYRSVKTRIIAYFMQCSLILNSTSPQSFLSQFRSTPLHDFSFSKFSENNVNGLFVTVFASLEIPALTTVSRDIGFQHAHCIQNANADNLIFCIDELWLASKNHEAIVCFNACMTL